MKPTNLNKETCNPISSNCVIWQGPDIPCIKLCKGDSVSDVVAKLASELCTILDVLNVENYDLSCFNITACGPSDFQQLIQFIIDQICSLENIPSPDPEKSGGCPDCLVTVNQCKDDDGNFIFLNQLGETTQLVNYVQAIASKICTIVFQIGVIEKTLVEYDDRITILESYFPLPAPSETEITPAPCLGLPLVDTPVSTVVTVLGNEFCDLIGATGTASEIVSAYISQCIDSTDQSLFKQYSAPGTSMLTEYPTWVVTPGSLADAITNLWLAVCDVRNAGDRVSVVAAGANITVTPVVSVVGADQVTTYTVAGANKLQVLNESVSLTPDASSMDFVGDLVTATNSGSNVTVTVNTFGGMRAQGTPASLPTTAFALGNVLCFQPVQVIPEIYDDENAYDPLTGVWTCPATGRYNLSCYAHYTRDEGTGWYNPSSPGGMFCAGISGSTGCTFYCANFMTVMGIQKHIDITAQAIGINITAGTQLSVKVLNQTGYAYAPLTGDVIRFTVERIK